MLKTKLSPLVGALAFATLIAGGIGPAMADEIAFGTLSPTSGTCSMSTNASDEGNVCSSPLQFQAEGATLTATGYSDEFSTTAALTNKPETSPPGPPANGTDNGFGESGLGENALNPANGLPNSECTDNPGAGFAHTECEIGIGAAVTVSSTVGITDLVVGSVQPNAEVFQVFGSTSGTTIDITNPSQLIGTFSSNGATNPNGVATTACPNYANDVTCTFDFATPFSVVGVYELTGIGNAASDSLVTAVSIVPAPPIGQGLPAVIAIGGLLFGVWAWDRSKKRRSLGVAAITHAAA